MTVEELIGILENFPQQTKVYVNVTNRFQEDGPCEPIVRESSVEIYKDEAFWSEKVGEKVIRIG